MTVPSLSTVSVAAPDVVADVLVIGVQSGTPPVVLGLGDEFGAVSDTLSAIGFSGGRDEVRRIPATVGSARAIALVGLGSTAPTPDSLRHAAGTAARSIRGVDSIAFALPATTDEEIAAVLEGAALGAYTFTRFRSSAEPSKRPASEILVVAASAATELAVRAAAIAESVASVRDLVNTPASHLYPATFADEALGLTADLPVEVTVFDEQALVSGGFGGILGVGQGSTRGPRLVKVAYSPESATKHLAIVGKGITFDSGGLSLKPAVSMVGMKNDMAGAATALAVVTAAARLAVPVRLTAWLCIAENMPSGSAIRPNDVLTIRGGKTVEVLNTDAEGRLVMADGLVAASEEYPDAIIDIATLTGAASVAMGTRYSAVMGEDALVRSVVDAGTRAGELLWAMPLPQELRPLLDSDVADLANVKIGNTAGGMLIAGIFLREFVGAVEDGSGRIPWAHIDIAGTATNAGSAHGYVGTGATGVAVRTLLELAEDISRK